MLNTNWQNGKTLYYCKSKLILMLLTVTGICACLIFVGYRLFCERFPYGSGLIIVLVLLINIKTIPALLTSRPALCINPQGFFVSSFLVGIGRGWIGWDEVEVLGKQKNAVTVVLKNPKDTKPKLSRFYNYIPTFQTSILRIGPSFSLDLTTQELYAVFDEQFSMFTDKANKLCDFVPKAEETNPLSCFNKKNDSEPSFKVYGFHNLSKAFRPFVVIGEKNFKYIFSDSLYRYEDIYKINKTYYSPDPHLVGQILDRITGKLVPRLIIEMKNGTKIRIDYYITREDMLEVSNEHEPTKAFNEIEDFLILKIDEIRESFRAREK